eukprot:SAG11_NODE_13395_length_657_cov_1.163082_1_plen_44_part_00
MYTVLYLPEGTFDPVPLIDATAGKDPEYGLKIANPEQMLGVRR